MGLNSFIFDMQIYQVTMSGIGVPANRVSSPIQQEILDPPLSCAALCARV